MYRTVSKLAVVTFMFIVALLFAPATSNAAEISPDPSTYSNGSTSEFSAYRSLNDGSSVTGENLADTGSSTYIAAIISGVMLCGGAGYLAIRKQKQLAK